MTPAPVGSVSSSDLPPLQPLPGQDGVQGQEQALVPGSPQDLQAIPDTRNTGVVASQDVRVSPTLAFDQQAVLGLWNVAANGDVCALSLNLTTWTGGFRASTRKCTEEVLTRIGAWQLSGQDLLLFDAKGSPLARLAVSGPNRFDGMADSINQQISVFR
ncbi:MAG: AprI/Inh family metalloprotease inhibitor [Pseudomonadota bacterium]